MTSPNKLVYARSSFDCPEMDRGVHFAVTPLSCFEETGFMDDQYLDCPELEGAGFYEVMEGVYEYDGDADPEVALASIGILHSPAFQRFIDQLGGF